MADSSKNTAFTGTAAERFREGVAVLLDAIEAAGGKELLLNLNAIDIRVTGTLTDATQYASPAAMGESHPEPISMAISLDFVNENFRQDIDQRVRGGLGVRSIFHFSDGKLSIIWPHDRTYSQFPGKPDGILTLASTMLPPLLLKEAMNNAGSVSLEHEGKIDGEKTNVIGFSWQGKKRYFLHVGQRSKLVRALEYVQTDTLVGDDNSIVLFEDYQEEDGVMFPTRIQQVRRAHPYADVSVKIVATNEGVVSPAGPDTDSYKQISPPVPTWVQIAESVFEVRNLYIGNYRSTIVEMEDSVVVFDAPVNALVAGQVRQLIAQNLGTKPVSHLILSHYHIDHVGGLAVYGAEGARIITAPGNEDYLTEIVTAQYQSASIFHKPSVSSNIDYETVEAGDTFTISDGKRIIKVSNIGPIEHVDGMLVAFVDDVEVAINGDLYACNMPANGSYEAFRHWLSTNHPDVRLISGVHHEPVSGESYFE